jgi:hypothetical protein
LHGCHELSNPRSCDCFNDFVLSSLQSKKEWFIVLFRCPPGGIHHV